MVKKANKNGFLIIELVLTLSLIVIFSSCIIFSSFWFSRYVTLTELKSFQSFFRYVQHKAIVQREDIKIICDIENSQCVEENTTIGKEIFTLHNDIRFQILPGILGPPASAQHIITKPTTFIHNTIVFYKTGVISSGTIYLLNTQSNTQYALSNAISPISFLRLYQYKNGKWEIIE